MTTSVEKQPGFIKKEMARFWAWYESHYTLYVSVAAVLFALQVVHLLWLTLDVVMLKAFGTAYFPRNAILENVLIIVDWFEIPALLSVSLVYINEYRQKKNAKSVLYLLFLNSQWIHILWITDEFVVGKFSGGAALQWPVWLAWTAIGIDYLELPVIVDTMKRLIKSLRGEEKAAIADILREKDDEPVAALSEEISA